MSESNKLVSNIYTSGGLVETPIECFVDIEGIKCFVNKDYINDRYVVSEYSTGFSFKSFGATVDEAIATARNKIKSVGIEWFMEKVNEAIAKYGIANKENN